MANSNYSKSKLAKKNAKNLVLARTGLFYGLKYIKVKEEKISSNRGITSTPNFLFYENNTKVMIDFSDNKNTTKKEELDLFWNLLVDGMTFGIYDAELINSNNKIKYDLSGVYTFKNLEDMVVFAEVNSVEKITTDLNLYSKTDFSNLPNFIFTNIIEPEKKETLTTIVNSLGKNTKNSFNYIGAKVGDFIQLQGKQNKFEVADYSIDSEGKEIIKVYGDITEEDRTNTKTFIGLFVEKKNENIIDVDITDQATGACYERENGVIISCVSNNTNSQCLLRKTSNNEVEFALGFECEVEQDAIETQTDYLRNIVTQQNEIIQKLKSYSITVANNQQNLPFR